MEGLRRFIRLPWRSAQRIARDVDDEIAFHLEMRAKELMATGLTGDAARERARQEFGNIDRARRSLRAIDHGQSRAVRRDAWFAELGQDIRYAARQLRRAPGVTAVATITLALGIGANAAIFSVVHRLLIDPIPLDGGDRLAAVWRTNVGQGFMISPSMAQFEAWKARSRSFEALESYSRQRFTHAGGGAEPEILGTTLISHTFPRFLRITPILGRGFTEDETRQGGPRVIMLSEGFWRERFGANRDALGTTMTLDGVSYTIVGVMPAKATAIGNALDDDVRLWAPFVHSATSDGSAIGGTSVLGRLAPGVTREQAQKELDAISAGVPGNVVGDMKWRTGVIVLRDRIGRDLRPVLTALMLAVGVLLLIACANVANLMLARGAIRVRELALRAALGAGRWRLVRQQLVESLLLAMLGGGVGLVVARWGLDAIRGLRPADLNELETVTLNPAVLTFGLTLAILTGLLFGILPALQASRVSVAEALKQGAFHGGSARRRSGRSTIVVGEVALSILLLVGAGLLARSVMRLQSIDPGFRTDRLLVLAPELSASRYPPEGGSRRAFSRDLLDRVRALPGVEAVTTSTGTPPNPGASFGTFEVEGQPVPDDDAAIAITSMFVARDFFRTMGMRFVAGRTFDSTEVDDAPVVIISESTARKHWPEGRAVGGRMRLSSKGNWMTVVGVVKDIYARGPLTRHDDMLQLYFLSGRIPMEQELLIRAKGDPLALIPLLKQQVWAIDKSVPVGEIATIQSKLDRELVRPRFNLTLLGVFALLALVLASVGLYGVIAYSVSQRTREIGIRMALGARGGEVQRLIIGNGLRLATLGLVLGAAASLGLTKVMAKLLYGMSALDAPTYLSVAAVLLGVAMIACWIPARRAARVDPLVAIRSE